MKERKDKNTRILIRVLYCIFFIALFAITALICVRAPVQRHFKNIRKNDVWFGDGWYYTELPEGEAARVTPQAEHYLKIHTKDDSVSITKVLDFTPEQDEYLCFRARRSTRWSMTAAG